MDTHAHMDTGIPKIQGDIKMTILFFDKSEHRPWKATEAEKENFRKRKGDVCVCLCMCVCVIVSVIVCALFVGLYFDG